VSLTGGNRNDVTQPVPLIDAVRPIGGRWVVERAFAHVQWFRRLRIRRDRHPEMHTAFLLLSCAILCWRRLRSL
jgi:hypothetical protein